MKGPPFTKLEPFSPVEVSGKMWVVIRVVGWGRGEVALFDMPNLNQFDILSISIFCKIALSISISISIFSKITISISISILIFLELP